jgi:hypothetical protein
MKYRPQDPLSIATRQVNRKLRFFLHLSVYLLVNAGLITLHVMQGASTPWSFGPLFGWGIGLLFHALTVFVNTPSASWKQRMIEKEVSKLKA